MLVTFHPLLGYKTPPLTAMYQPMMMHQTHGPPPVALLLRFLGVTYVNTSCHTAPLHHPSRVKASIAIVGFDLADLHSHLPQKSTFFNTKYT